jgi:hypothetical protein
MSFRRAAVGAVELGSDGEPSSGRYGDAGSDGHGKVSPSGDGGEDVYAVGDYAAQ